MKQLFLLMFGLYTFVFSSCSSDELSTKNIPKTENTMQVDAVELTKLSSLQLQIDSLNQSMFPLTNSTQTRGIGKFFKKFFSIVVCDAVGGLHGSFYGGPVGSVGGAILASSVAAFAPVELSTNAVSSEDISNRPVNSNSISLSPNVIPSEGVNSSLITFNDSIGYLHNEALIELNQTLTSEERTIDKLALRVIELTSQNYDVSEDSLSNYFNANMEFYNNIISENLFESSEATTVHEVMSKWKDLYPEQSCQLDVLESFFNGIYNLEVDNNDGTYLNRVLEIIDSSSLNTTIKQNLRNAFIVGNASYQLWNTEE